MKKILVILVLFVGFAFPAFSQSQNNQSQNNQNRNANADRNKALSDAMANTIEVNTEKLATFDDEITGTGSTRAYSAYKRRYDSVVKAMEDSEYRFRLYVRTNDRADTIQKERDHYEELLEELKSLKSEYDKR